MIHSTSSVNVRKDDSAASFRNFKNDLEKHMTPISGDTFQTNTLLISFFCQQYQSYYTSHIVYNSQV